MPSGGYNFWFEASAKMDGAIVTVAHDEFRGMGLSGVQAFLGAEAAAEAGNAIWRGTG